MREERLLENVVTSQAVVGHFLTIPTGSYVAFIASKGRPGTSAEVTVLLARHRQCPAGCLDKRGGRDRRLRKREDAADVDLAQDTFFCSVGRPLPEQEESTSHSNGNATGSMANRSHHMPTHSLSRNRRASSNFGARGSQA
jgi:hypothetical protein